MFRERWKSYVQRRKEARRLAEERRGFEYACSAVLLDRTPLYYVAGCSRHTLDFTNFDRGVLQATAELARITGESEDLDDYETLPGDRT